MRVGHADLDAQHQVCNAPGPGIVHQVIDVWTAVLAFRPGIDAHDKTAVFFGKEAALIAAVEAHIEQFLAGLDSQLLRQELGQFQPARCTGRKSFPGPGICSPLGSLTYSYFPLSRKLPVSGKVISSIFIS